MQWSQGRASFSQVVGFFRCGSKGVFVKGDEAIQMAPSRLLLDNRVSKIKSAEFTACDGFSKGNDGSRRVHERVLIG